MWWFGDLFVWCEKSGLGVGWSGGRMSGLVNEEG